MSEKEFGILYGEKINKLAIDVEVIKNKIDNLTNSPVNGMQTEQLQDHEARIRGLEKYRNKTIGAMVFGQFLIGLVIGIIIKFI